jgi:uncharacterized protein (DUF2126 family)
VDTWNNRAIGGCRYYVGHPGGRSYDTFPVNSYEAESRRISRFWDHGHTQAPPTLLKAEGSPSHFVEETHLSFNTSVPEVEINNEYPNTLDLRRFHSK